MIARSIFTALALALAGCVSHVGERVAECRAQTFRTSVERAKCLNRAELSSAPLAIQNDLDNARLALAAKVDTREITQVEADQEFDRYRRQAVDRETIRTRAMSAAMGAMIGAGVH